ncbi:hypothetical protein BDQ17DRAFT_1427792 [Cyathus striatus]|nr:hypothetical protein BDQ17DRAFT_1427792 [Cyathus striatus]
MFTATSPITPTWSLQSHLRLTLYTPIPPGGLFWRATCATSQLAPSWTSSPSSGVLNSMTLTTLLSAQRSAGGSSVRSQLGVVFDPHSGNGRDDGVNDRWAEGDDEDYLKLQHEYKGLVLATRNRKARKMDEVVDEPYVCPFACNETMQGNLPSTEHGVSIHLSYSLQSTQGELARISSNHFPATRLSICLRHTHTQYAAARTFVLSNDATTTTPLRHPMFTILQIVPHTPPQHIPRLATSPSTPTLSFQPPPTHNAPYTHIIWWRLSTRYVYTISTGIVIGRFTEI